MAIAGLKSDYHLNEAGVFVPDAPLRHRDDEYNPAGFDRLRAMQERHFWYLGRHRFILRSFLRFIGSQTSSKGRSLSGLDLGGGCGGWIRYLQKHQPLLFSELAIADSSLQALGLARDVVGPKVDRYQTDLLDLPWSRRWDVIFLLDVLEHIPADLEALRHIAEALRPGGLLLVTTPALGCFWTHNDVLNSHVRRYSRSDFRRLAETSGLELRFSRYFMFFLSPLLLISRLRPPKSTDSNDPDVRRYRDRSHRVPNWLVNQTLRLVFSLETPVGVACPFPWGTSVLAVLQKPF